LGYDDVGRRQIGVLLYGFLQQLQRAFEIALVEPFRGVGQFLHLRRGFRSGSKTARRKRLRGRFRRRADGAGGKQPGGENGDQRLAYHGGGDSFVNVERGPVE